MKNLLKFLSLAFVCAAFSACVSDDNPEMLIGFYVGDQNTNIPTGVSRQIDYLPLSKTSVVVDKKPFMLNGELIDVNVAKIPISEKDFLYGFQFQCNPQGTRKLAQVMGSNMNKLIVVKSGDTILGVRPIDTVVGDGRLFVVSEVENKDPGNPDMGVETMQELSVQMNKSIKRAQEILSEK